MADRARFYRYGGIVVRLYKGSRDPVRITMAGGIRAMVPADGRYPRAAKSFAPLPKRFRKMLRDQADSERRVREARERLAEQGVEIVEHDTAAPWTDLRPTATGALA